MSEVLVRVRKLWGNFPEATRMRGVNIQFNENGEASVPQFIADIMAAELSHEYAIADESGVFQYPTDTSTSEVDTPKRKEVTDEERDMRGELARLRLEVPQMLEAISVAESRIVELQNELTLVVTEKNSALLQLAELQAAQAASAPSSTSEVIKDAVAAGAPPKRTAPRTAAK